MPIRNSDAPRSVTTIALAKTIKLLLTHQAITVATIAAETGVHETTASRLVHALHHERVIYISGWVEDTLGRDQTPLYTFGDYADAPRRKKSGAQRSREYRAARRAEKLKLKGHHHVD